MSCVFVASDVPLKDLGYIELGLSNLHQMSCDPFFFIFFSLSVEGLFNIMWVGDPSPKMGCALHPNGLVTLHLNRLVTFMKRLSFMNGHIQGVI